MARKLDQADRYLPAATGAPPATPAPTSGSASCSATFPIKHPLIEAVTLPIAMNNDALRIAMWSGPRNISPAMMRDWGNRPDTTVCDEPLYAHFLATTGRQHPGADEVIAEGPTDIRKVIDFLL